MSRRSRRWKRQQEKIALRLVVAPMIDPGPGLPAWIAPVLIELEGNAVIIRVAYARFSPDHPCHAGEPDYAPDYTAEGARVLTWIPPVTVAALREAALPMAA